MLQIIVTFMFIGNFFLVYGIAIDQLRPMQKGKKNFKEEIVLRFVEIFILVLFYWPISKFILKPFNLQVLDFPIIMLLMTGVNFLEEQVLKVKDIPSNWKEKMKATWVGFNPFHMAFLLLVDLKEMEFLFSFFAAFIAMAGIVLVIWIMRAVMDKIELEGLPENMKGIPALIVSSGLMSGLMTALEVKIL